MNPAPDTVVINVRDYAATYIATAKGVAVRASCTSGAMEAAAACADKLYGPRGYVLKRVTAQTYTATALHAQTL
jgi:hypothetical protein